MGSLRFEALRSLSQGPRVVPHQTRPFGPFISVLGRLGLILSLFNFIMKLGKSYYLVISCFPTLSRISLIMSVCGSLTHIIRMAIQKFITVYK